MSRVVLAPGARGGHVGFAPLRAFSNKLFQRNHEIMAPSQATELVAKQLLFSSQFHVVGVGALHDTTNEVGTNLS